jgi:hypothetical protein
MRNVLLLMLVLMLTASLAFAQTNRVGLFGVSDPTTDADCNIADVSGLLPVYAVHLQDGPGGPTMIASQFKSEIPGCFTGTWLSDTAIYPVTVGNSQVGVAIGYGVCIATPIHVLTINLFASGTTPPCCIWPVEGDPNIPSGLVEFVNCDNDLLTGVGQSGIINADGTCPCADIVATDDATWGKIKALYH